MELKKIELNDSPPDITVINPNWDKIDTEIQNLKDNKVTKETGKGLSTNDYTTTEKNKLSGIATGANNYSHPATHPPEIIVQDENNRFMTDTERNKLAGIAASANNYTHPSTHPPTILSNGTLPAGVVATNSTDYTTSRPRNIQASTTDLTAGSSSLANGAIYLVYE